MKIRFVIIICAIHFHAQGQDWVRQQNDAEFVKYLMHGLKVGDKMPNISLGPVLNNYPTKKNLWEYKGKLIILDFWFTDCSVCIHRFPEMEKLQQEFGDRIQIFLVNPIETKEQIRKKNIHFPNLPILIAPSSKQPSVFRKLFPLRSFPHHVWIDSNMVIRVAGDFVNTYPDKVKKFLSGEKVLYYSDGNMTIRFSEKNSSLWSLMNKFSNVPYRFGSLFTPFNNEYNASAGPGMGLDIVDSSTQTIRNTFVNAEVLAIYTHGPFKKLLTAQHKKILAMAFDDVPQLGFYDLHVKDTLRYTNNFKRSFRDIDYFKSQYCYEQVLPYNIPEEERSKLMLDDLNRYFGTLYGAQGRIIKKNIPCYILVRTSDNDKLASVHSEYNSNSKENEFYENGIKMYRYTYGSINDIGEAVRSSTQISQLLIDNKKESRPFIILNETGFNNQKPIDIALPDRGWLTSLEQLRNSLIKYDLDIITANRDIYLVEFSEDEVPLLSNRP